MVIWSEPAKVDPRSVHDFIAHDSRYYAKKVAQDIAAKTDLLDELPRMGPAVPELGSETTREIPLYSYRIVYEIREPDIVVLAVIHRRRELRPDMIDR